MRQMLIVEDEPDLRECLQEFFGSRGFSVAGASSGDEAVEWLGGHSTDLLLVDVVMPGRLSGLDVVKQAKQLYGEAQIIMVTGVDRPETRTLARQYGAIGYIVKPFDFSEATWAPVLAQLTHPVRLDDKGLP